MHLHLSFQSEKELTLCKQKSTNQEPLSVLFIDRTPCPFTDVNSTETSAFV
jgi:hypothetical protein